MTIYNELLGSWIYIVGVFVISIMQHFLTASTVRGKCYVLLYAPNWVVAPRSETSRTVDVVNEWTGPG